MQPGDGVDEDFMRLAEAEAEEALRFGCIEDSAIGSSL